ncbi:MAG: mannose-1-phosphate guanylyltransferase, partial [Amphiplicatus sp.]
RGRPTQFLALAREKTLFQETAHRLAAAEHSPFASPLVIAGAGHVDHIRRQLAEIGVAPAAIITEPQPRNTAAVAAVAAAWTEETGADALVLLTPADHHVADPAGFRAAVEKGARAAAAGAIVTFGVQPTHPHAGYGYIERGAAIAPSVYGVAAFREKPDEKTAARYLASGAHYWNSGIFLFSARTMLAELKAHAPEIYAAARAALDRAERSGARIDLDKAAFESCPANSIDYAVMEKTAKAAVVGPVDVGWNDIGAWSALSPQMDAEKTVLIDAEGTLVRTDGPFVGVIGAADLIVVASEGAVLVARRDRAEDVKKLVEELKARGRDDLL